MQVSNTFSYLQSLDQDLNGIEQKKQVFFKIEGEGDCRHVVVVKGFWSELAARVGSLFGVESYNKSNIGALLNTQVTSISPQDNKTVEIIQHISDTLKPRGIEVQVPELVVLHEVSAEDRLVERASSILDKVPKMVQYFVKKHIDSKDYQKLEATVAVAERMLEGNADEKLATNVLLDARQLLITNRGKAPKEIDECLLRLGVDQAKELLFQPETFSQLTPRKVCEEIRAIIDDLNLVCDIDSVNVMQTVTKLEESLMDQQFNSIKERYGDILKEAIGLELKDRNQLQESLEEKKEELFHFIKQLEKQSSQEGSLLFGVIRFIARSTYDANDEIIKSQRFQQLDMLEKLSNSLLEAYTVVGALEKNSAMGPMYVDECKKVLLLLEIRSLVLKAENYFKDEIEKQNIKKEFEDLRNVVTMVSVDMMKKRSENEISEITSLVLQACRKLEEVWREKKSVGGQTISLALDELEKELQAVGKKREEFKQVIPIRLQTGELLLLKNRGQLLEKVHQRVGAYEKRKEDECWEIQILLDAAKDKENMQAKRAERLMMLRATIELADQHCNKVGSRLNKKEQNEIQKVRANLQNFQKKLNDSGSEGLFAKERLLDVEEKELSDLEKECKEIIRPLGSLALFRKDNQWSQLSVISRELK